MTKRVLDNLIGNAIAYSSAGGHIEAVLGRQGGDIRVENRAAGGSSFCIRLPVYAPAELLL
jgi:two-component system, OmpR family, sensor kinase